MDAFEMNPISRVIDTTCGISSPWRALIKNALEVSKDNLKSKDEIKINVEIVFSSIKEMQKNTNLFRETGGCHGAAIFDFNGKILGCKEDIGRHNAVDKVLGESLVKKIPLGDKILVSSGRVSSDIVKKTQRAKISLILSRSAPTSLAIELAQKLGITIVGFARGKRMNIYTYPMRVIVPDKKA